MQTTRTVTEPTNSRNAITQQNNDEHSSQRYRVASDFLNDEPHTQKHSSQDYVNTPKIDLLSDIDAVNEKDDTSKPHLDLNSHHDTESTTSTVVNISSNIDDFFKMKVSHVMVKTT